MSTLSRRGFLKGLIASVSTGALIKGGVVQPEQILTQPNRTIFDMAENTWRDRLRVNFLQPSIFVSQELIDDAGIGLLAPFPRDWSSTIYFSDNDQPGFDVLKRAFMGDDKVSVSARYGDDLHLDFQAHVVGVDQYGDSYRVELAGPLTNIDISPQRIPRGILGPDGIADLWRQA